MTWAATGRLGGTSIGTFASLNLADHVGDDPARVASHRDLVRRWIGAEHLVALSAVHGSDVAVIDGAGSVPDPVADAVVTQRPDIALLALGADCLTLGIVGDDDLTVAAVHCGWRGLVGDVVGSVLRAVADVGARPAHVILGPAICGSCYPVPPERADLVRASCTPEVSAAALVTCADGQPGIDVRRGVLARLGEWGLASESVVSIDRCTAEDPELFSHRRDGVTGRQGLVISRAAGWSHGC